MYGDIFDIVDLGGQRHDLDKQLLDVTKIKLRRKAPCISRNQDCPLPHGKNLLTVLGAPCVLFSRWLAVYMSNC